MATKDKILAYVRKTPANTNVNVLGTMLDSIAENSGGTVEVSKIKIASVSGGGESVGAQSTWKFFLGGGQLTDGKTLGELVGDKTVVDFAFVDTNEGASNNNVIGTICFGGANAVADYETAKDKSVCTAFAVYTGGSDTHKIDIYAICI